ncbi:hypothetical protein [Flavobacterium humi]|uniref:hypothetical protein n=1 Tax=Flavobacterium humi TaxID=2562683 RepID=UPI001B8ABFF6|nr:hypothetical protein [Flavobacterium humi]
MAEINCRAYRFIVKSLKKAKGYGGTGDCVSDGSGNPFCLLQTRQKDCSGQHGP